MASIPNKFTCPLTTCVCGGKLGKFKTVQAVCYDLIGSKTVDLVTKKCVRRKCRLTYGYNYYRLGASKVNCVSLSDLNDGVLFTNATQCFTLRYLEFFTDLAFRGHVSSKAVVWAYARSFVLTPHGDDTPSGNRIAWGSRAHTNACLYYLAVKEFSALPDTQDIVVGEEVSKKNLAMYGKFLHTRVFPPRDRSSVREAVGDGHSKVLTKCANPTKHGGKPRTLKKPRSRPYTNGWFMVCQPNGHVLHVQQQIDPENNDDVAAAFAAVVEKYPKVDCLVYDRNCGLAPKQSSRPEFKQIKYWSIDKVPSLAALGEVQVQPKLRAALATSVDQGEHLGLRADVFLASWVCTDHEQPRATA